MQAVRTARAIAGEHETEVAITLTPSEQEGCFQIWLNGKKVFDKDETSHIKAFGSPADIARIKALLEECLKAPV